MKVREQFSHWNNFSVQELKDILGHCVALERLGIAQDEEMMTSIERDIALRDKKPSEHNKGFKSNLTKTKQQIIQDNKKNRVIRITTQHKKQTPQNYVLEKSVQTA
jgi:hypothetical protein